MLNSLDKMLCAISARYDQLAEPRRFLLFIFPWTIGVALATAPQERMGPLLHAIGALLCAFFLAWGLHRAFGGKAGSAIALLIFIATVFFIPQFFH